MGTPHSCILVSFGYKRYASSPGYCFLYLGQIGHPFIAIIHSPTPLSYLPSTLIPTLSPPISFLLPLPPYLLTYSYFLSNLSPISPSPYLVSILSTFLPIFLLYPFIFFLSLPSLFLHPTTYPPGHLSYLPSFLPSIFTTPSYFLLPTYSHVFILPSPCVSPKYPYTSFPLCLVTGLFLSSSL